MFGPDAVNKMPEEWSKAVAIFSKDSLIKYGYVPYHIIYMQSKLTEAFKQKNKDSIFLLPLGDPSFLHPDFNYQPVVTLIKNTNKQVVIQPTKANDQFGHMGNGWAWNDYGEDYQPERSRMPIYGNVVHFYQNEIIDQSFLFCLNSLNNFRSWFSFRQ